MKAPKKETKERIKRALAWSAASTAATLLFVYLTFPWNAVRQRIEDGLSSSLRGPDGSTFVVSVGELKPSWFTGVVVKRLVIVSRDPAAPPDVAASTLVVPELDARLELWPLLRRTPTIDFTAKLTAGEVVGQVRLGKKDEGLTLNVSRVDLGKAHDLLTVAGRLIGADLGALDLGGAFTARAALAFRGGDVTTLEGTLQAGLDQAVIKGGKVGEYDLPRVALGKVDLGVLAGGGKLDVRKLTIQGDDVDVGSDGLALTLNRNFGFSMPHGKLRVHFGADLLKRIPYLGLGLSALHPPDRDGSYSLSLSGTLRNPRFM